MTKCFSMPFKVTYPPTWRGKFDSELPQHPTKSFLLKAVTLGLMDSGFLILRFVTFSFLITDAALLQEWCLISLA